MKKRYVKNVDQIITAVQLNLDTAGFEYQKWDGVQQCGSGDWIVDNDGDCYTINEESFANTYQMVAAGRYKKTAYVWAEQASEAGTITTREGSTSYSRGDYIVYNSSDESDGYAVAKEKFESMYVSADSETD